MLMVKSRRWVLAPAMVALVLRPWLAAAGRHVLDAVEGDQPAHGVRAVPGDREALVARAEQVVVDELADRHRSWDGHRVRCPDLAGPDAAEPAGQDGLLGLGRGRPGEEPADQRDPQPAPVPGEEERYRPPTMQIVPKTWPARLAHTVAFTRSPVRHQMTARNSLPPSSGAAGITLKIASITLVAPR